MVGRDGRREYGWKVDDGENERIYSEGWGGSIGFVRVGPDYGGRA